MQTLDEPINDLINDFLADQDIAENSRNLYEKELRYFLTWIIKNKVNPAKIEIPNLLGYKNYLKNQKLSPYTIDNYLAPIKLFFKNLDRLRKYKNIAANIKNERKLKEFTKRALTPREIKKLLNSIERKNIYNLRDYAMIKLIALTGMRCIETSRLNINDLQTSKNNYLINILGKGQNEKRALKIPESAANSIIEYIEQRKDPDYKNPLFVNRFNNRLTGQAIGTIIKNKCEKAGIKDVSAHSLRHSAAVNGIKAGQNIYDIQKLLGHSSVKITELYLKSIEKENIKIKGNPVINALNNVYKI